MSTKIEWTDEVWNPVTGCEKVSQGCKNCYAERIANRFWGERKFTDVMCHEDRLGIPLKWKKPRRVFVNSMSDLFHEDVPLEFIRKVFKIMWAADRHTYQILTKRPERMHDVLTSRFFVDGSRTYGHNVWLGVSCEDQKTADERIPLLLQTPAAVRFVSLEPLLGKIDLTALNFGSRWESSALDGWYVTPETGDPEPTQHSDGNKVDWIIVGGESGPNARPMHPDWVRSIRDQCQEAGVPLFFKQWGEWKEVRTLTQETVERYSKSVLSYPSGDLFFRIGKKAAGRLLDEQEWNEYPEVRNG